MKDLNFNGGLTVSSSQKGLRLLGGNSCVASGELGHDTTEVLNTEGGSDIEQKNVTDASRQDSALDGRTKSNTSPGSTPLLGSRSKTLLTVSTTYEKYH